MVFNAPHPPVLSPADPGCQLCFTSWSFYLMELKPEASEEHQGDPLSPLVPENCDPAAISGWNVTQI